MASKKTTKGFNVTIPYKKKIFKHLNTKNVHAKNIGAVNCVIVGEKIKGTNTDWEGYYKTIPMKNILKTKRVVIIGYGGAALAIHYVLKLKGFKNIEIFNRSKKKLSFEKKNKYTKTINSLSKSLVDAGLIINTTPTNPINVKYKRLIRKKTVLSDIIYKPKETKFLKNYPENKKIYGISMLLEQAIPCFKTWFGFTPVVDSGLIKILDKKIK